MSYAVDFKDVMDRGLESSPHAGAPYSEANEARYPRTNYGRPHFVVEPAAEAQGIDWIHGILADERDLTIASEAARGHPVHRRGHQDAYVFPRAGRSTSCTWRTYGASGPSASSLLRWHGRPWRAG